MKKIATFDDWIDAFREWQKDIGLTLPKYSDYQFDAKYGELKTNEIEFGDFRGQKKWERVTQIPHQPIRDALLNLIVYQGDTEFASVEQQMKSNESLSTLVANGFPLISTCEAATNLAPFTVKTTPCSTCVKSTVLGDSDPIMGTGRALPQNGFNVLLQPGRNNTARSAARVRRGMEMLLYG